MVGSYPRYSVLTFEEPASSKGKAQLSLYEASPSVPSADFGSYNASSHTGFKQLGSAKLGEVVTVSLGAGVSNFGGYAGHGNKPFTNGDVTLASVNTFDRHNVLPFHNASRLSLFLFDAGEFERSSLWESRPMKVSTIFALVVAAGAAVLVVSGCGTSGPAPITSPPTGPANPTPPAKWLYVDHNGTFYAYPLPLRPPPNRLAR